MDDLREMGLFPTAHLRGRHRQRADDDLDDVRDPGRLPEHSLLPVRAGGIIFANVAPVIALRSRVDESTSYPDIQGIGCFAEQHTFSSWVYAAASANMLV